MLQLIQHSKADILTLADRKAMLDALEDMLSLGGVVLDEQGNSYHARNQSACHESSHSLIYAEFKYLRSNTAMVTLRQVPREAAAKHQASCSALFILAKSDEDWEVMGLPLPLGAANF